MCFDLEGVFIVKNSVVNLHYLLQCKMTVLGTSTVPTFPQALCVKWSKI